MGRVLLLVVVAMLAFFGLAVALGSIFGVKSLNLREQVATQATPERAEPSDSEPKSEKNNLQDELSQLSATLVSEVEKERRLNLGLYTQLKAYRSMLDQVQGYASKVEQDMNTIEEISSREFQEDIALQASLFAGKKPEIVAQHLEEFKASRVGAILSKMKEKEASAVLDIWAKNKEPRVSKFYRDVMGAYLNNRRYEANPELYQKKAV
ncbi:MAG: hypothetical protein K0S07_1064 [Chlamydiales bacterium]|jgi:flagellar motility protein MotE (MotC chaperone)|nr:hypothetical protein [Chlamydiales bacterium]